MKIAKIVVPFPLYNIFDYKIIDKVYIGSLVNVSFSKTKTVGLVIDIIEVENYNNKIKTIDSLIEIKKIKQELIDFIKWVADYNIMPIGLVFKLIFSEKLFLKNIKEINVYSFIDDINKNITEKQKNIINFLKNYKNKSFAFEDLKHLCSLNIIKTLVKNGIIIERKIKTAKNNYEIDINNINLNILSEEQNIIYNNIINFININNKPILLEGATGSGKTEIYFHLFNQIIKKNNENQILFLLPEIALTTQFIDRVKSQFNCKDVAVWHSNITDTNKKNILDGIINGNIKIIMGARSALFLPFNKLSLIIVDEEHDGSYKQTDNGCYNARDMAIVRAKINKIPIILGSATPSLESLINVENKKYNYVFLKNRFGQSVIPDVEIINLQKEKLKYDKYLSKQLINEIKIQLDNKKQVMLFMNRRGYAPIAICRECGHRFSCPHCSSNLTVHRDKEIFMCHQCGYKMKKQEICPSCGQENSIIYFGAGVEKIENEIKDYFQDKTSVIITSDTVQNTKEIKEILKKILNNEIDIIIGTQMITKGYDFPNLMLVGILDADASLFGANFRATERTYQLLTQVIGRSGRREERGKAIIQTYSPDNLIIQALKNNDKNIILNFEKENRKLINLPPYGKMVLISISGNNEINVYKKIKEVVNLLPNNDNNIEIYGPTPMTLYKFNNDYRFKIIVKTTMNINIQKLIMFVIINIKLDNSLKLKIDVNPYFL